MVSQMPGDSIKRVRSRCLYGREGRRDRIGVHRIGTLAALRCAATCGEKCRNCLWACDAGNAFEGASRL
jgi:hypothetical protein